MLKPNPRPGVITLFDLLFYDDAEGTVSLSYPTLEAAEAARLQVVAKLEDIRKLPSNEFIGDPWIAENSYDVSTPKALAMLVNLCAGVFIGDDGLANGPDYVPGWDDYRDAEATA